MINRKKSAVWLRHVKDAVPRAKIRTKLFFLILMTGISCLLLFRFLWLQKWDVWGYLIDDLPIWLDIFPRPDPDLYDKLAEEAANYDLPASDTDEEAIQALEPFLELADEYTSIYIYGREDGMFRAGYMPQIMVNDPFRTFFDLGYEWTNGAGEQISSFPLKFKNGYGTVHIAFYHSSCFIYPYFLFCLILCILLFLSIILFFVDKKMKLVVRLEETVLRMSSGDLATPVLYMGQDELGILSRELDSLRSTLCENFRQQQELHRSSQELMAALSHDLRTPLTILKGYLEILRLDRNREKHTEYVGRCIQKADDIQKMTDRMFEYALVYDEGTAAKENAVLSEIPLQTVLESLKEHEDFLHLAGFHTEYRQTLSTDADQIYIAAEDTMLKRIWSNLFSNIIKYADKKEAVVLSVSAGTDVTVVVKNVGKDGGDAMESNQIGLKSVKKMMGLMGGEMKLDIDGEQKSFAIELKLNLIDP